MNEGKARIHTKIACLTFVLLSCVACGEEAPTIAESQPVSEPAAVVASGGEATFQVNGVAKHFNFQDRGKSSYYKQASVVHFQPESGAAEWLAISLIQVDLKILQYPTDLPLPRDLKNPMSLAGTMASVGIGYIDSDGNEWAGPGTVHLESFDEDGKLTGSFDEVQIPHTGKTLAPVTLSNGRFEADL